MYVCMYICIFVFYCSVVSMDWFIKSKICGMGDREKGIGGVFIVLVCFVSW